MPDNMKTSCVGIPSLYHRGQHAEYRDFMRTFHESVDQLPSIPLLCAVKVHSNMSVLGDASPVSSPTACVSMHFKKETAFPL